MNTEIKDQWVKALRSGEYEQGRSVLQDSEGKFCCLGVLCDLAVKAGVTEATTPEFGTTTYGGKNDPNTAYPPAKVVNWAGLDSMNPRVPFEHEEFGDVRTVPLTALNDNQEVGLGFAGIADVIEEHL